MPRAAGGEKWWDPTLTEWPENDFRIFVGDLGNEVNDDVLTKAFQKFTSFAKAKVIRNKHTNKTKGARLLPLWHIGCHAAGNIISHECRACCVLMSCDPLHFHLA